MNYPTLFDAFTEDDFERQALNGTYVEPTSASDPYHDEVQRISHQLSIAARSLSPKDRKIVELFYQGKPKTEIITTLKTSYVHIAKTLASPKGIQVYALLTQLSELRGGPTLEARRAMMWRIAHRSEVKAPGVSLKAIDIMNKQAGDYATTEVTSSGLTVNIQSFTMAAPHPQPTPNPPSPPQDVVIEGDFTPVQVETK